MWRTLFIFLITFSWSSVLFGSTGFVLPHETFLFWQEVGNKFNDVSVISLDTTGAIQKRVLIGRTVYPLASPLWFRVQKDYLLAGISNRKLVVCDRLGNFSTTQIKATNLAAWGIGEILVVRPNNSVVLLDSKLNETALLLPYWLPARGGEIIGVQKVSTNRLAVLTEKRFLLVNPLPMLRSQKIVSEFPIQVSTSAQFIFNAPHLWIYDSSKGLRRFKDGKHEFEVTPPSDFQMIKVDPQTNKLLARVGEHLVEYDGAQSSVIAHGIFDRTKIGKSLYVGATAPYAILHLDYPMAGMQSPSPAAPVITTPKIQTNKDPTTVEDFKEQFEREWKKLKSKFKDKRELPEELTAVELASVLNQLSAFRYAVADLPDSELQRFALKKPNNFLQAINPSFIIKLSDLYKALAQQKAGGCSDNLD